MKRLSLLLVSALCFAGCRTASVVLPKSVPTDRDGFPTGQTSPEGAACDAVRAWLRSDSDLWLARLVRPIYGAENLEYTDFKKMMVEKKKANARDPDFPRMQIVGCYQARPFSLNGPASAAYALELFKGNMFVDIVIGGVEQEEWSVRYHVMLDEDGKWYFEPRPDLAGLFATGLNDEEPSTLKIKPRETPNKPAGR
jgi:hypothetical protein